MNSVKSKVGDISTKIKTARINALSETGDNPNRTQQILENIYGKSTPEIKEEYSTWTDRWHNYIDIGD